MLRSDDGLAKMWRLKQRVALTPSAKPHPEVPCLQPQGNRLDAVVAFGALNAEQPVGGEADTPAAGAAVDTPDKGQPPRARKGGLPVDASEVAPPANTSEAGAAGDAPGVGVPAGAADRGVPAVAVDIVRTADTAAARAAENAPGRGLLAGAPDGAMQAHAGDVVPPADAADVYCTFSCIAPVLPPRAQAAVAPLAAATAPLLLNEP